MLNRLLDFLSQKPNMDPLSDHEARLALCALLVRLARADHDYTQEERKLIQTILANRYQLTAPDAQSLLEAGEAAEIDAPDTQRFTAAIKNAIPLDERMFVLEAAWQVVMADGARAAEENAIMRMIPRFLGISDFDSNRARKRVSDGPEQAD